MNKSKQAINIILTFLVCLLIFQSCTNKVVDLKFDLLPTTIEKNPYQNVKKVVFVDSLNNMLVFEVSIGKHTSMTMTEPVTIENLETGEVTDYYYTSEIKDYLIVNDSLDIEFRVQLEAIPYKGRIDRQQVKDELSISIKTESTNTNGGDANNAEDFKVTRSESVVFTNTVDLRTYPDTKKTHQFDSLKLLNKNFINVFEENLSSDLSFHLNFNYEFGIISFYDADNKLWRFEKFIYAL